MVIPAGNALAHASDVGEDMLGIAQQQVVGIRVVERHLASARHVAQWRDEKEPVSLWHTDAREQKGLDYGENSGVGSQCERHRENGDDSGGLATAEEPQPRLTSDPTKRVSHSGEWQRDECKTSFRAGYPPGDYPSNATFSMSA